MARSKKRSFKRSSKRNAVTGTGLLVLTLGVVFAGGGSYYIYKKSKKADGAGRNTADPKRSENPPEKAYNDTDYSQ